MNTSSTLISFTSALEYETAMQRMEYFAKQTRKGGFLALTESEQEEFGTLAQAIEEYEHQHFPFPTSAEMLEHHGAAV